MTLDQHNDPSEGSQSHAGDRLHDKELFAPNDMPVFVAPEAGVEAVLELAGFATDQYVLLEDVPHWTITTGGGGYESDDGRRDVEHSTKQHAVVARLNNEGLWEIGTDARELILRGDVVSKNTGITDWRDSSDTRLNAPSLLVTMGIAKEEVLSLKEQLDRELEEAQEAFLANLGEFFDAFRSQSAYSTLLIETQELVRDTLSQVEYELGQFGNGNIDMLDDLQEILSDEWETALELAARQEDGEILVNYGGTFRSAGNKQVDYFVITSDGNLRQPDSETHIRNSSHGGTKRWRVVEPDDVAITYTAYTPATKTFEATFTPQEGLSEQQISTIHKLEESLGAPTNSARLDPILTEQQRRATEVIIQDIAPIVEVMALPDIDKVVDNLVFTDLASKDGVYLGSGLAVSRLIIDSEPFAISCSNRAAQVTEQIYTADGILEFLVYEKYGDWQLNMRWREITENDDSTTEDMDDEPSNLIPADEADIEKLKAFFNN